MKRSYSPSATADTAIGCHARIWRCWSDRPTSCPPSTWRSLGVYSRGRACYTGCWSRAGDGKICDPERSELMEMPQAERAVVDVTKLHDYCLSATHPRG